MRPVTARPRRKRSSSKTLGLRSRAFVRRTVTAIVARLELGATHMCRRRRSPNPLPRGRELTEGDRQGTLPVAVVSELFARTNFGDADPVGRHIEVGGSMQVDGVPRVLEIVGVAASARYGGLKGEVPPVVYVSHAQVTWHFRLSRAARGICVRLLRMAAPRHRAQAVHPRDTDGHGAERVVAHTPADAVSSLK